MRNSPSAGSGTGPLRSSKSVSLIAPSGRFISTHRRFVSVIAALGATALQWLVRPDHANLFAAEVRDFAVHAAGEQPVPHRGLHVLRLAVQRNLGGRSDLVVALVGLRDGAF